MTTGAQVSPALVIPHSELIFRTSRSGGPGGQNVNKLETRVELLFDLVHSPSLTHHQRTILLERLKSRVDAEGVLHIVSQESRSQWKNKQAAIERLAKMLRAALKPRKKRVRTKPSKGSKERRLQAKKLHSEKKRLRGSVDR